MRFLPEKRCTACAGPVGSRKASCFSAVPPVSGWNQCVKWVAPFPIAQSFIPFATASAIDGSRGFPSRIVASSFAATGFGRNARIAFSENTSSP